MKNARLAAYLGWALLGVSAIAVAAVIAFNRAHGDLLGAWRLEYAGGGSAQWRSEEGKQLQTLLIATLWTHLAAPLAALLLLAGAAGAESVRARAIHAAGVAAALALFTVLVWMSLLKPAFEIAP